jgi:hypothetical protein
MYKCNVMSKKDEPEIQVNIFLLYLFRLFVVVITQVMAINIRKDSFCSSVSWKWCKKTRWKTEEKFFFWVHCGTHTPSPHLKFFYLSLFFIDLLLSSFLFFLVSFEGFQTRTRVCANGRMFDWHSPRLVLSCLRFSQV